MSYVSAPIKEFVYGIYDGPHATPKESSTGKIFLGIGNVTSEGRLDLSEIKFVSDEEFPKWTKRVTPTGGDVVFSYEATLHRYALIPEGFEGCLGRRMALIRPNQERLLSRYLHYYLLSPKWRAYADTKTVIGATVNRLPIGEFPQFVIRVPGIDVQKRVVDILANYDDLIENNLRRIVLLEEAAGLLFDEWFVRRLFPGHEHVKTVGGLPEGWHQGVVSDFGRVITGKTPPTSEKDYFGDDVPFVKTPDMHASSIIVSTEESLSDRGAKYQENKTLPINSILVACIGAKLGVVSLNARVCQTNQQINAVIPHNQYATYFAYFTLKGFRNRLLAIGGGATMPNVNKTKFASMSVVIPSSKLVEEFQLKVEDGFKEIKLLLEANEKLGCARNLFLPRLINGEIAA